MFGPTNVPLRRGGEDFGKIFKSPSVSVFPFFTCCRCRQDLFRKYRSLADKECNCSASNLETVKGTTTGFLQFDPSLRVLSTSTKKVPTKTERCFAKFSDFQTSTKTFEIHIPAASSRPKENPTRFDGLKRSQ